MNSIKIDDLFVKVLDKVLLNNINICVEPGEKVALLGDNGAGKTTLLHAMCGLVDITSGEVNVGGQFVRKGIMPSKTALIFQNPDDQMFMPTVYDDVYFGAFNVLKDKDEAENATTRVLNRLGIGHLRNSSIYDLSGGEKRLVTIAGALVMNPDFMLLDEPSSFLDVKGRNCLLRILSDLKCGIVVATHDLNNAAKFCDRGLILKRGKLFFDGSVEDIMNNNTILRELGYIE